MSDPKFTEQDTEADESILWTANPHLASKIGAFILGLFIFPIGIAVWVAVYINVKYTTYALTDNALYIKKGFLSTKVSRLPLSKIQNTEYSRSFIEQQLGYGTVSVSSAGTSGAEIQFRAVPNPEEVKNKINEAAGANETTAEDNAGYTDEELLEELRKTREAFERMAEQNNN